MSHLRMTLRFNAPVSRLYEALSSREGPRGWWTRFCEVSEEVGGVSRFRFPAAGFFADMRVTRLEPGQLVEWECVDSRHPPHTGWGKLDDWIGTTVRFRVGGRGGRASTLEFEHQGLTPDLECFDACESGWSFYLNQSLRSYLERGSGQPYADDSENNIRSGDQ